MANAALSCAGQANAVFFGIVVVVVVVGEGTVVVVVVDPGTVVVVVVVEVVVVVVVDGIVVVATVVVVVVEVVVAQVLGRVVVVVVVDARAGSSCADVLDVVMRTSDALSTKEMNEPRIQWWVRRVTQRMYNAPMRATDASDLATSVSLCGSSGFRCQESTTFNRFRSAKRRFTVYRAHVACDVTSHATELFTL
jgi:hypothetical protein